MKFSKIFGLAFQTLLLCVIWYQSKVFPATMTNNANRNASIAEGHTNEPVTREEFTQFAEETRRTLRDNQQTMQELLAAIQRLSANPNPGVLPTERVPVARISEAAMEQRANPQ